MSTQGKGNFTFEILKNGAKPGSSNPVDGIDDIETSTDDTNTDKLNVVGQQRSKIKAAPEPEKLGSEKSLGRKRQH